MAGSEHSGLADRSRRDELLKVAEQAAAWLIELEEGGAAERAACAAWLEESPLHVEMFLRASSVDRITELMAPGDVQSLARRKWDADDSVIDFPAPETAAGPAPAQHAPSSPGEERNTRWHFAGIAAAMLALVATGFWYVQFGPGAWDAYLTQVGEQRTVSLADGSVIHVNTDSRIEVHYTETTRDVRLRDGEALFKVEHDPRRPFRVHAGDSMIQAVGTQFNVYRRSSETKVAVVEGIVQVSKDTGAFGSTAGAAGKDITRLAAGEGLNLGKDGAFEKPTAVNVSQVTAWRERRLVFEWRTLGEIAAEFNRYNRTPQIRVEGTEIAMRRYTAVFDADNPQSLLRFLSKDENLQFAAEGDDFVIRAR